MAWDSRRDCWCVALGFLAMVAKVIFWLWLVAVCVVLCMGLVVLLVDLGVLEANPLRGLPEWVGYAALFSAVGPAWVVLVMHRVRSWRGDV